MKSEHINPFLNAVIHVISTMAMVKPTPGKPYLKKDQKACGDVSGIIGLTGDKRGVMALSFSTGAACTIVGSMLGVEYTSLEQDVLDAVGELTNMISGDARRRLSVDGYNFEAGIPTIISGENHTVESSSTGPVIVIPFTVNGHGFVVEASFEN